MQETLKCKFVDIPSKTNGLHCNSYTEAPVVIQSVIKPNSLVKIGGFTGIYGPSSTIHSCSIGRFCSIADGVVIGPSEHPVDWLSTSMVQYVDNIHGWNSYFEEKNLDFHNMKGQFRPRHKPVSIGNDVWIGARVFIKSGVQIGDGAVVSVGSVVVKDVPPYSIVGGVPAKVIRHRFSEDIVESLLSLKWWQYNIFSLKNLNFNDVDKAIQDVLDGIQAGTLEKMQLEKVYFKDI